MQNNPGNPNTLKTCIIDMSSFFKKSVESKIVQSI